MPLIDLGIEQLVPETLRALMNDNFFERILDDVATLGRNEWIRISRRELNSSKMDYLNGIQEVEVENDKTRVIALVGGMPNAIEWGMESFDMRDTLLRSEKGKANAKRAKDGSLYRAIPFRHGTPGSKGQAGTPMGEAYGPRGALSRAAGNLMDESSAKELGKRIYAVVKAKQFKPTVRDVFRSLTEAPKTSYGDKFDSQYHLQEKIPLLRGPNPNHPDPRMRAGHKTDIYKGMMRVEHPYIKETENGPKTTWQSQYSTFRTISERNPNGWIHPGIEAHHFMDRVVDYIQDVTPRVISSVIDEVFHP